MQAQRTNKIAVAALAVFLGLGLAGCSGMNDTQQATLSGGAIGAAVGAAGTALTGGCVSCGAALGGAVGAGSGYVIEKNKD
jgi:osmotically inducible lipoprotein OsmB